MKLKLLKKSERLKIIGWARKVYQEVDDDEIPDVIMNLINHKAIDEVRKENELLKARLQVVTLDMKEILSKLKKFNKDT